MILAGQDDFWGQPNFWKMQRVKDAVQCLRLDAFESMTNRQKKNADRHPPTEFFSFLLMDWHYPAPLVKKEFVWRRDEGRGWEELKEELALEKVKYLLMLWRKERAEKWKETEW